MVLRRRRTTTRGESFSMYALLFCAFLCFFSSCALFSINCNEEACKTGFLFKDRESIRTVSSSQRKEMNRAGEEEPGSDPPQCTYKCGDCTPCKAVHVPVPPGTTVTTEYYPEAWFCKCGKKFFMP